MNSTRLSLPLRGRVAAKRPGGVARSRDLRKNMTDAERKMWFILRDIVWPKAHFRRQVRIGPFHADFLSHHFKLVIEVDGSQHFEPEGLARDEARTKYFAAEGYSLLRFGNHDVLSNASGVADRIIDILSHITPTPTPPHKGEGQKRSSSTLPLRGRVARNVPGGVIDSNA